MKYDLIKRFLDILFACAFLIFGAPFLLIIAFLVKKSSPGPAFFCQRRIGKEGSKFIMLKFRTMYSNAPKNVATNLFKNPNKFITPLGAMLRKTSLDETPQAFNILLGHMSFVGPRPALPNQTELLKARIKNGSYKLRPGLTGLAQVNGRDEIPEKRKAALDGRYLKNYGAKQDIKIIIKTLKSIIKQDGR